MLDLQKKPVPAAAFAAFFEDREHEAHVEIDIKPLPLTAGEERRKVFISYAWEDAEVVEELSSALEKDGFLPIRDRDQIRPGDRISPFIHRLTRGDLVVAVISDKYLRSPYCMYEIYKLWQKHQEDADSLVQSLVPIVLPEVKIGSFEERALYQKHWGERARTLETLIRDPDLRPSRESWDEVRLVRKFAEDVDGILVFLQDVLKLEAHLDDDFPTVREALRRRLGSPPE